jgi:hypothetical protein
VKITRVETLVLKLPMVIDGATPMLGSRARTSIDMLLVRVETDAGITGWGEAFGHRIFPATRAAIDTLLGPMCVGRDASAIAALTDDQQRALHGVGRGGSTLYALSGIDIALWDIAGKAAGLPLYRLLGGAARADLPAYASLLRYGAAAAVAHYTEQALARGYRHIKVHEVTVPEIKAARDVAGPSVLSSWSTPTARGPWSRLSRWRVGWHHSTCAGWRSPCGRPRTSAASPRCAPAAVSRPPLARTTARRGSSVAPSRRARSTTRSRA